MTDKQEKIRTQVALTVRNFYPSINKNSTKVKFKGNTITIKSSILRVKLGIDVLIICAIIKALFRPESDTYWFPVSLFIFYFLYSVWEDLEGINIIKIDIDSQILKIRHTNPIRHYILNLLFRYKNMYPLTEIKDFTLKEKYHFRAIYKKNYILLSLTNNTSYIILDIPDLSQAQATINFLNIIVKIK